MFEGLFQPMHLMIIAGIALLVFGPKKLPELGKGMGEGIRGFKAAMQGKRSCRHQVHCTASVGESVTTTIPAKALVAGLRQLPGVRRGAAELRRLVRLTCRRISF